MTYINRFSANWLLALATSVGMLMTSQAAAQSNPAKPATPAAPAAKSITPGSYPVLDRLRAGGKLVIAHRESSVPFSYLDGNKKPVGYALDLGIKLAETVRSKLGLRREDGYELLMVTTANRITMIAEGKADLECDSTTNN